MQTTDAGGTPVDRPVVPLVARLREMSRRGYWPLLGDEAADEIERLQAELRKRHERLHETEDLAGHYLAQRDEAREQVAAERDCRTCKHWTPHHRSDVMHCSAALRCVAGSSYRRQGVVRLWEAAPVDAGF